MPIKCKLCDKEFKNKIQYRHLKGEHNMTVKEYELIYGKGSTDLNYSPPVIPDDEKVTCKECGEEFKNLITNTHLKIHSMTVDDYRQKYGEDSLYSSSYRSSCSEKVRGENNPNFGNKWSDVQKQSLSEKLTGREAWNKGVAQSDEQKKKQSETKKRMYASGELVNHRKGATHTDEAKRLLSIRQKEYAENNKDEMSKRGKKAYKTMKEKYGEDYFTEHQQKMRSSITKEGKERQRESLILQGIIKKEKALQSLKEKLLFHGYKFISMNDDLYITYACPNNKQHTNRKNYFVESCWVDKSECRMCLPKNTSKGEIELRQYIESLGIDYEVNNRSIIWPYEVDILIPSHNLAIEYNGLYWHSKQMGKDQYYHLDKTRQLSEKGYELIHLFEDEFHNRGDVFRSIISNKLGLSSVKYDARKLTVETISKKESKEFLDSNHLYGNGGSYVSYALKTENEIVSVMTFVKNDKYQWELKRFANKCGCIIRGGASKLFSAFVNNMNPESVLSYSDKRFSNGEVYEALGFEHIEDTKPTEWFFKNTGNLNNLKRVNWRYIVQRYRGENTRQQAFEDGWYLIYDCGHSKYLWRK